MKRNGNSPKGETALDQLHKVLCELARFEGLIRDALHYANHSHTFDDIVAMVFTQRVFFIPLERSFFIVEKLCYPQHNCLHLFLGGGDLDEILAFQPKMQELARLHDCKYVSVAGRAGWQRVLEAKGWRHISTTMILEAEDGNQQGRQHDNQSGSQPCH